MYARQSKGKDDSIKEQLNECTNDALAEGMDVIDKYEDRVSASRYEKRVRGAWQRLLADIKSGKLECVALWESSRGSREMEDWVKFLKLCREHKVRIRVKTHGRTYKMENARDFRSMLEDGVDSEYESEKTKLRGERARQTKITEGRPHGRYLYGYTSEHDKTRDRFNRVEDPEKAAVVREAASRVARGDGLRTISLDFNRRGVPAPSGGLWDQGTQVRRLVSNPGYIGQWVEGTRVVGKASWAPILDEETFYACRDILSDKNRRSWSDGNVKHLLNGIATCAKCGGRLRNIKNRGILMYQCAKKFCVSIREADMDEYVVQKVKERLFKLETEELDNPEQEADRRQARQKIAELEEYLNDFVKTAASERISAKIVGQVERDVQAQIGALDAQARAVRLPRIVTRVVEDPELWASSTVPEQREIVRDLFTIELRPCGRVGRYGAPPTQARVVIRDARTGQDIG